MIYVVIIGVVVIIIGLIINEFSKKSSNKNPNQALMDAIRKMDKGTKGVYWKGFKERQPKEAKDIEQLLNIDMSQLGDVDAFEIVTTFKRWSSNSGIPIGGLKKNYYDSVDDILSPEGLDIAIDILNKKIIEEAKEFNISKEHTICHYMLEWTLELQKGKKW